MKEREEEDEPIHTDGVWTTYEEDEPIHTDGVWTNYEEDAPIHTDCVWTNYEEDEPIHADDAWTNYNRRVVNEYIACIDKRDIERLLIDGNVKQNRWRYALSDAYRNLVRSILDKLKLACQRKAATAETEAEAEDDEWSSDGEGVYWTDDDMYNFLEDNCTFDGLVRHREQLKNKSGRTSTMQTMARRCLC